MRECPPGLIYDPDLTSCNIETEVDCPFNALMMAKKPFCPLGRNQSVPHSSESLITQNLNFYTFLCIFSELWPLLAVSKWKIHSEAVFSWFSV